MSQSSGTTRRAVALATVAALILLLGGVGVVTIDQGRAAAGAVTATAEQVQRLDEARVASEAARRLVALGKAEEAGKTVDTAAGWIRMAIEAEDTPSRKAKIEKLLPLVQDFHAGVLAADKGSADKAGAVLADELAALDHLAEQDFAEASAEGPAQILQDDALFGIASLILAAVATVIVFIGMRRPVSEAP